MLRACHTHALIAMNKLQKQAAVGQPQNGANRAAKRQRPFGYKTACEPKITASRASNADNISPPALGTKNIAQGGAHMRLIEQDFKSTAQTLNAAGFFM